MASKFDALVIGGGPAGSTTAILLANAGWSVGLIERKRFPRRKVCGEYLSASNLPFLEKLGIAKAFYDLAGPCVSKVGLFTGRTILESSLPRPSFRQKEWGRALSREHLDTLLLRRATECGVASFQPCSAVNLERINNRYRCRVAFSNRSTICGVDRNETKDLFAGIVIAAHGSWDIGALPTQLPRKKPAAADLFGFKAHFSGSSLPIGLMPLLAFPGGYGGMVHCDGGRISLSLCIRRDFLNRVRRINGGPVGEAILQYIVDHCDGVKHALKNAKRYGEWLSTGPIRPGIRLRSRDGVLPVGNAAGEAHPVVAEGISMAIQGGWLLAERLIAWDRRRESLARVEQEYADAWRRSFGPRLRASAMIAQWAMNPTAVAASLPLLRCFPNLLSWGARWSGKATQVLSTH